MCDIFCVMSDIDQQSPESEPAAEKTDESADLTDSEQGDSVPADHQISTEQVIEALLFASEAPLSLSKIVSLLGVGTAREVRDYIESLNKKYENQGSAFHIEEIAGGYQMLTLPAYNTWIRRLKQNRQDSKLSPAALETLALVAYKQPVVRADIEAVRGVSCGELLNRLRELGLIKIVGRAEDVGRPMLYGTTKRFLEIFALSSLDDLPEVEELQASE
ncbi:MAG: SMC-Scp complex subunit ScpB [Planctomycetota bacterium]|nr:MAG: SMC-Scp complex subunit ScpB [Planctomycetota bacterium]